MSSPGANVPNGTRMKERAAAYSEACGEYTDPGERVRLEKDWERKADMAEGVVRDFRLRAMDPEGKELLEVGFGNGLQLAAFIRAGARMHGLEVNRVLHQLASESLEESGLFADLRVYEEGPFPYPDDRFDGGYSVSVLEHVSDPGSVLHEIGRVLKPGARFYLAFPNKFAPRETHSRIWFLSYLPREWGKWLLRFLGRSTIDDLNLHFISYFKMKSLLRGTGLRITYEHRRGGFLQRMAKRILAFAGIHHSAILPHIMVILEKNPNKPSPQTSGILRSP